MGRALLVFPFCVALGGCQALLSFADDCPNGRCLDASNDAASDAPDVLLSQPNCRSEETRVTVTVASNVRVGVELDSLKVAPGETKAVCLVRGSKSRMETSDGSDVRFAGVLCEDGQNNRRCEFEVPDSSVVVTVSR